MPEELYEALVDRARRERRSLAQQAIVDLERAAGMDVSSRRADAVRKIRGRNAMKVSDPVAGIRRDRGR